jgi:hypothetical protein
LLLSPASSHILFLLILPRTPLNVPRRQKTLRGRRRKQPPWRVRSLCLWRWRRIVPLLNWALAGGLQKKRKRRKRPPRKMLRPRASEIMRGE